MSLKIIFPFIVCFFFFSCGNKGDSNKTIPPTDTSSLKKVAQLKSGLIEGLEIVKFQKVPNVYMMGRIGDTTLYCSEKGKIEISDSINKRHQIIDLKVVILVDQLYVIPRTDHKWFLVWQETFQEGIRTYAALYDDETQKPEWKILFPVPNPAKPVVDGDVAYVSALGVVAKISLNEGSIIWKQDSLFNQFKLSYQKMEKAHVYPDKIVFVDFPKPGFREVRDTLVLDPITGVRKK